GILWITTRGAVLSRVARGISSFDSRSCCMYLGRIEIHRILAAGLIGVCVISTLTRAARADGDNPFSTPEEKLAAAAPRTWSDASGKFKIEARLLRVDNGNVVLRR